MEIEEFIEQDIIVFLDRYAGIVPVSTPKVEAEPEFLTRDYEEELVSALEREDIPAAKRALHDLKDRFDTIPNGTPQKEQIKTLLTGLYGKLKEHIDAQHNKGNDRWMNELAKPKQAAKATHVQQEAANVLDEVEQLLAHGDIPGAARRYRDARRQALAMPQLPEALAMRFTVLFDRIKKGPERPAALDKDLTLQLEREKAALDRCIESDDFPGAMQRYRRMRLIVQQMSDKAAAEAAAEKLVRIYTLIDQMRGAHSDQSLMRTVP